jgi:UPF0755 protein
VNLMDRTAVDAETDETADLDDLGLGSGRRSHRRPRARARRGRGCFAVLLSLAVIAALVAGVVFGLGRGRDYLEKLFSVPDYAGPGTGSVTVEITRGQTSTDIAKTLESKDVVKSAKAFERAAREDSRSRSIQAGTYQLRKQMSAKAALALLLAPESSLLVNRVSIPAGKTVREATAIIQASKAARLPPNAVAAALRNPRALGLPAYAANRPEGFLYPGTYDLPKGATATSILRQMTAKYAQVTARLRLDQTARSKHIEPYDAVRVASIIQAETNRSVDYPKVARVIYNRLNRGMRLQMDSTIHYMIGRTGSVFTPAEARQIRSPYNTYLNGGLPPTPINSPTEETLRAALHPATGDWLYFVTVNLDTGETAFAATPAEHNANRARLAAWCGQHRDHPGCK